MALNENFKGNLNFLYNLIQLLENYRMIHMWSEI